MYKKSPLYTPGNAGKSDIVVDQREDQRSKTAPKSGRFDLDHEIATSRLKP